MMCNVVPFSQTNTKFQSSLKERIHAPFASQLAYRRCIEERSIVEDHTCGEIRENCQGKTFESSSGLTFQYNKVTSLHFSLQQQQGGAHAVGK